MNKKDPIDMILKIMMLFCILTLIILVPIAVRDSKQKDLACEDLGLMEYEIINRMEYCEDDWGNLHYIKLECKPWYWVECSAKLISVGDVRVRK